MHFLRENISSEALAFGLPQTLEPFEFMYNKSMRVSRDIDLSEEDLDYFLMALKKGPNRLSAAFTMYQSHDLVDADGLPVTGENLQKVFQSRCISSYVLDINQGIAVTPPLQDPIYLTDRQTEYFRLKLSDMLLKDLKNKRGYVLTRNISDSPLGKKIGDNLLYNYSHSNGTLRAAREPIPLHSVSHHCRVYLEETRQRIQDIILTTDLDCPVTDIKDNSVELHSSTITVASHVINLKDGIAQVTGGHDWKYLGDEWKGFLGHVVDDLLVENELDRFLIKDH
jgi:hypothetical protein